MSHLSSKSVFMVVFLVKKQANEANYCSKVILFLKIGPCFFLILCFVFRPRAYKLEKILTQNRQSILNGLRPNWWILESVVFILTGDTDIEGILCFGFNFLDFSFPFRFI